MKKFIPFWWLSILIVLIDQTTKFFVRNFINFGSDNIIKITDKFFWLTHVQNTGAAFSISFGNLIFNKIFFITFTLVAIFIIIYVSKNSKSKIEQFAFALILGGAIGNLIDRIIFGSVTDFIWWDFPDFIMERWPVFNIADSSIVIALTIFSLWNPIRAIWVSFLFGGIFVLQYLLQPLGISPNFLAMLPYVATLVILFVISLKDSKRLNAPAMLGEPYKRGER